MWLLTPCYLRKDINLGPNDWKKRDRALKTIAKLEDQQKLYRAAEESYNKDVRVAAAEKLTDQTLLARFIEEWDRSDDSVLYAKEHFIAIKNFTDYSVMARVLAHAQNPHVKYLIEERFQDIVKAGLNQEVLAKVALGDYPESMRKTAALRLEDQQILAKLALGDYPESVRRNAVSKLEDQKLLAKIARTEARRSVKEEAISKITDENVLIEIADACDDADKDGQAVEYLFHRCEDAKLLVRYMAEGVLPWKKNLAAQRLGQIAIGFMTYSGLDRAQNFPAQR